MAHPSVTFVITIFGSILYVILMLHYFSHKPQGRNMCVCSVQELRDFHAPVDGDVERLSSLDSHSLKSLVEHET